MTPRARQAILDVAEEFLIHPSLILAHCRLPRVYRARVEVAKRLRAFGYSTPRIGLYLRHDHTTILYYLGHGKKRAKRDLKLTWHTPHIMHLHCRGCHRCRIGPKPERQRARRTPKPRSTSRVLEFLMPYAGADWTYEWKERPREGDRANATAKAHHSGSGGHVQHDLHRD